MSPTPSPDSPKNVKERKFTSIVQAVKDHCPLEMGKTFDEAWAMCLIMVDLCYFSSPKPNAPGLMQDAGIALRGRWPTWAHRQQCGRTSGPSIQGFSFSIFPSTDSFAYF